jgi:Carboxypeptidase regulatory-like domain
MRFNPLERLKSARAFQVLAFPITILTFGALILFPSSVRAQTDRATLEGTITDSKGGTIAAAQVQTTELDTGIREDRVTNEHGNYRIPGLAHGGYTVVVTRDGFQTKVVDDVELQVGETHTLDVSLSIGAVTEKIERNRDWHRADQRSPHQRAQLVNAHDSRSLGPGRRRRRSTNHPVRRASPRRQQLYI